MARAEVATGPLASCVAKTWRSGLLPAGVAVTRRRVADETGAPRDSARGASDGDVAVHRANANETATTADGYAVAKTQDTADNLAVYFNEPNHSFIIHAIWWNDAPFAQVSEVGQ